MAGVIILNPHAGRGQASRRLKRIPPGFDLLTTRGPGDAEELSLRAAQQGRQLIVAAGGDGTVHEVANGILRSGCQGVRLGIIPVGSSNDYHASFPAPVTGEAVEGKRVDVGVIRGPGHRQRYFLCGMGLGLNGAVTLEARRIRRLQGVALYGVAALRAMWKHFRHPTLTMQMDDLPPWTGPTLMLSLLLARREGGFTLAPQAILDDGLFEYVHAANLSRLQVLRLLPQLAVYGPPASYPQVRMGKCRSVRLRCEQPLIVHTDGEFFCQPQDHIKECEVELLPRRLTVVTDPRGRLGRTDGR